LEELEAAEEATGYLPPPMAAVRGRSRRSIEVNWPVVIGSGVMLLLAGLVVFLIMNRR
jgi:hypothetical protein